MIGDNIKLLRSEKGLKQSELAEILKTTQSTISKYECNEVEPDIDSLVKLSDFFGCSVDYLLGREREDGLIVIDNSSNALSDVEQHIIEVFRMLTNRNKIKVVGYVDGIYAGQQQGA
mgnify:CR=1 FL=1